MPLDPRIETIRQQYGLDKEDFWELPQKRGAWCVKHAALEVVAAKAGISFDMPQVLEAKGEAGIAAVCVQGTLGSRSMWSIGECSPKNNKNAYPWAMAEKRAIDRVVLKLVGIHGLVYSEEEADDFKESRTETKSSASLKRGGAWEKIMADLEADIVDVRSLAALDHLRKNYLDQAEKDGWTTAWRAALIDRLEGCEADIRRSSLWEEMTSITTLGGLKSFWEDNLPTIKALGSKSASDFTDKKEEMKAALLARQSTLAAG